MIRVARDVRGPAFVALDQQADGIRTERHGGGVKLGFAENQSIGLFDVGNDEFIGLPTARNPRKRKGRRGQLKEIAPVDGFIPLRSLSGKFAVQEILKVW